jgi:hypothetical protein
MEERFELIKKYAQDSILMGRKEKNDYAIDRGTEIYRAVTVLETIMTSMEDEIRSLRSLEDLNAYLMYEMVCQLGKPKTIEQ